MQTKEAEEGFPAFVDAAEKWLRSGCVPGSLLARANMVVNFQRLHVTLVDKDSAPAAGFNAFCDLRLASNAPGMAGLTRWEQLPYGFSIQKCLLELCNRREVELTMTHMTVLRPQERRFILRKMGRRLLKRRQVSMLAILVGEISPNEAILALDLIEELRERSTFIETHKPPASAHSGRNSTTEDANRPSLTLAEWNEARLYQEQTENSLQGIHDILGELADHPPTDGKQGDRTPSKEKAPRSPKRLPGAATRALRIRDACGKTALHWVHDPVTAEVVFAAVPPKAVSEALLAEDQNGQWPLEAIFTLGTINLLDQQQLLDMAEECDPYLVERLTNNGISLYMLLDKAAQNVPGRTPCVSWLDLRTNLEQTTTSAGLALLRRPPENGGPSGMRLGDHLFRCFTEAPMGFRHGSEGVERLLHVWGAVEKLISVALLGTDSPLLQEDQLNMAEELLEQTKGPNVERFDPREPYREALCTLMTQMYLDTVKQMEELYGNLPLSLKPHMAEWFTQDLPCDEIHSVEYGGIEWKASLPKQLKELPLTAELFTYPGIALHKRIRHDIFPLPLPTDHALCNPEWVFTRDVAGAYEALEGLDLIHCMHDLVQIANPYGYRPLPEDTSFARLHAIWLREIYAEHMPAIKKRLKELLGPAITPAAKAWPLSFEAIWKEAESIKNVVEHELKMIQSEVSFLHPLLDPLVAKVTKELRTPANWVCNIAVAELAVDTMEDLRRVYALLEELNWQKDGAVLLQTKNGFHSNAELFASSNKRKGKTGEVEVEQVRCIRCYLAVLVGEADRPFIVEIQLHFRKMREFGLAFKLANRCLRGELDHPRMDNFWKDRFHKIKKDVEKD